VWIHLGVNPDPWAIGPLGVGKRNGKYIPYVGRNSQLDAFKEAVKEELASQGVTKVEYDRYSLKFFFWRRLDSHSRGRKHYADATNMQKALEDALQDVLIGNDRDVRHVESTIVEQGTDVPGGIVIYIEEYDHEETKIIPHEMWDKINHTEPEPLFDNTWGGPML